MVLLNVLLPVIAVGSWLLLALLVSSRMLRGSPPPVCLAGAVCGFYGAFAWGFQILGLAGAFTRSFVLPTFVIAPLGVTWLYRREVAAAVEPLCADVRHEITALATGLRRHPVVFAGLAAIWAHVILRFARALATPAFGWDDYTYHLFRAGRWVQRGGIGLEPAPDAWTYYEFFPWGGDLIWAWTLVWGSGDVLVSVAAIGIWSTCFVLAYGLARRVDQEPVGSLVVATALVVLPSQLAQIATAYVDNVHLMLVLACGLLLLEFLRLGHGGQASGRWRTSAGAACLLGVGCGLGVLVKLTFLPLFGIAAILIAWSALRQRRVWDGLAFALGTTILIPNLAFNWYHRGSPFYPFRVIESLPSNAQLAHVLSQLDTADLWHRVPSAMRALVVNARPDDPFLNLGFAGVLLLVMGLAGASRLWSDSAARPYLIWVAASAAVTIGQLLSPPNSSMLTTWASVLGRFVVPSLAPIMVLSGRFPTGLRFLLMPMLVAEYFLYAPWRWPRQVLLATGVVLVALGIAWGVALLATRLRVRTFTKWSVITLAFVVALSVTAAIHDRLRYASYLLFADRRLDDFHAASRVGAWPIWLRLDEHGPSRVAAAAGWDGLGHNWFRYGLLGANLQHDVVYVPVTSDGSIVNYADAERLGAVADREAWLRRLEGLRVDWVVVTGPPTFERAWIEEMPEIFSVELTLANRAWILARVDEATLSRYLRSTR